MTLACVEVTKSSQHKEQTADPFLQPSGFGGGGEYGGENCFGNDCKALIGNQLYLQCLSLLLEAGR